MKKCPVCNKFFDGNFCPECGSELISAEESGGENPLLAEVTGLGFLETWAKEYKKESIIADALGLLGIGAYITSLALFIYLCVILGQNKYIYILSNIGFPATFLLFAGNILMRISNYIELSAGFNWTKKHNLNLRPLIDKQNTNAVIKNQFKVICHCIYCTEHADFINNMRKKLIINAALCAVLITISGILMFNGANFTDMLAKSLISLPNELETVYELNGGNFNGTVMFARQFIEQNLNIPAAKDTVNEYIDIINSYNRICLIYILAQCFLSAFIWQALRGLDPLRSKKINEWINSAETK